MAFRRSFSSSRRTFSRSSRFRRGGLKPARAPVRYNAADFFQAITTDHPTGSATMQLTFLHLASLTQSYTTTAEITSQHLQSSIKTIDIGGVVFDWGIEFPATGGDGADGTLSAFENMSTWYNVGLCYDRMNFDQTAGGFLPAAIQGWEPFFSDFPVSGAVADINQWEAQRPTRVLWNKTMYMNFGAPIIVNPSAGDLHVPQYQHIAPRFGTVNKRCRVRLNQDFGLFLYVATINEGNFSTDLLTLFRTVWAKGTLYWKPSVT